MRKLLPFLAMALVLPGPTAGKSNRAYVGTVFATVGQSEWCPPGTVLVDLGSGRYHLTEASPRGCRRAGFKRRIREGMVGDRELARLRNAYRTALAEGIDACAPGQNPERIVVSNGGPHALVVTGPTSTLVAPDELGCWTDAANRLHDAMQRAFAPESL